MNRIKALDGLRGVAILLVVSFHYINNQMLQPEHLLARVISKATYFGWIGVDLFFVLSGFLIGSIVIKHVEQPNFFKAFYLRRFLRIVPNYFLLIVLFSGIIASGYFADNFFLLGHNTVPIWAYFSMVHNFIMAQTGMGSAAMSVTWSIGIEEQFYLVFPLIAWLTPRRWLPAILLGCIAAAPVFRYWAGAYPANYVLPQCRMDGLAMGVLVSWLTLRQDITTWVNRYQLTLWGTFGAIFVSCGVIYWQFGDLGVFKQTLFSILFAIILLFALADKPIVAGFLKQSWLVWIGMISYPLYLFHYIILGVVHHLAGNTEYIGIHTTIDIGISVLAFGISLIFSWALYRWLETPLLQWGKKYSYR